METCLPTSSRTLSGISSSSRHYRRAAKLSHVPSTRHGSKPFGSSSRTTRCTRFSASLSPSQFSLSRSQPRRLSHSRSHHNVHSTVRCTASAESITPSTAANPISTESEPKLEFPTLQGKDFRHPLDQQYTSSLEWLPGVEDLFKLFIDNVAERFVYMDNITSSVLVGPNQAPHIHELLQTAARRLNMDGNVPDLYIKQNPSPNAYTLAINGRKPFIVVHTSLIELLSLDELQAVIAHELGHLKCNHGVWLTVANLIATSALSIPAVGGVVSSGMEEALMRWVRAAEFSCDRAALVVVQDPRVVASVLMKLAGGSSSLAPHLNVDAFIEQAQSYENATADAVGRFMRRAQTRELSHPLPVVRAAAINQWGSSAEYNAILANGVQEES